MIILKFYKSVSFFVILSNDKVMSKIWNIWKNNTRSRIFKQNWFDK